jgi:hypothetical protein
MTVISINCINTGPGSNRFIVSDNTIVTTGGPCWGVLVNGAGHNGIIHNNYFEGGSGIYSAISIASPANNVRVHHNVAVNWNAGVTGVFYNGGPNGSLTNNAAYGCSSPMLGTNDATTVIYGNSTGASSAIDLANVNITSGAAAFTGSTTFSAATTFSGSPNQFYNGASFGFSGAGGAEILGNSAAGGLRGFHAQTNGVDRWRWGTDNTSEGGSNAGSNFWIYRYQDGGGPFGAALTISRATGNTAFSGTVGVNGTTPPASKPTVTGSKGANAALASLLTALAAYGLITDSST